VVQSVGRQLVHIAIRFYQLTFSAFVGHQCRHLPSCSAYMDEAVAQHGVWTGGWMGFARICRCHPWGTAGFDPVMREPPAAARWYTPWRYGAWRKIPEPARPTPGR
jgi:putative membrane protein insertion efficiency factor